MCNSDTILHKTPHWLHVSTTSCALLLQWPKQQQQQQQQGQQTNTFGANEIRWKRFYRNSRKTHKKNTKDWCTFESKLRPGSTLTMTQTQVVEHVPACNARPGSWRRKTGRFLKSHRWHATLPDTKSEINKLDATAHPVPLLYCSSCCTDNNPDCQQYSPLWKM